MGTQLPFPKGAQPPIFGPYLLWPNGWMNQDATVTALAQDTLCYVGIKLPKEAQTPNFRPMSIVAKRSPISANVEHSYLLLIAESWSFSIRLSLSIAQRGESETRVRETLKPNSITLSGRRQVRGWSQTCRRPARSC